MACVPVTDVIFQRWSEIVLRLPMLRTSDIQSSLRWTCDLDGKSKPKAKLASLTESFRRIECENDYGVAGCSSPMSFVEAVLGASTLLFT